MSEEPRKRSRFDQEETRDPRRSRFDRRSRSPDNREPEPVSKSVESPSNGDKKSPVPNNPAAASAAAAAAARINAAIQAKKASLPAGAEIGPVRATQSPSAPAPGRSPSVKDNGNDIYQQDGDYIKDIEVNDLRNRYTLTKGSTQKMIKDKTGADVTTRGAYYPDKSMATAANPPLYLHITSTSKEGLEAAVAEIDEMMKQDLPNLIDERRFRRREPEKVERDEFGRRKWPEEKIDIDIEPMNGFNLRAQVVGQGGSYVKHIQQETRCRVQIKGRGSGFLERDTGAELDVPMYLHVAGPDAADVARAKELCEDLLNNVKQQYQQFKERAREGGGFGDRRGGHRDGGGYGGDRGDRNRDRSDSYGGGYGVHGGHNSYSGAGSPQNPQSGAGAMSPAAGAAGTQQDWMAQMAQMSQYINTTLAAGGDPYAAYGGYETFMAYYGPYLQYYQAAQQGAQGTPTPGAGAGAGAANGYQAQSEAPPPPPPSDDQPPPPPPPGADSGYNNVPPPPGM